MVSARIKLLEKKLKKELVKTKIDQKKLTQLKVSLRQAILEEKYFRREA